MYRGKLSGTGKWPGDDEIDQAASIPCEKAFDAYVGLPFDLSRLEYGPVTPDKEGGEDGDRTLICFVYDPTEETLRAPLKASAQ